MGDRLAEFLYATFINGGQLVAGSDVPNWASLPVADRERWQQVAERARNHVTDQLFMTLDSIDKEFNWTAEERLVGNELRKRYGRS